MTADHRAAAEELERLMKNHVTRLSSVPTTAASVQRPATWSKSTPSANGAVNGAHIVQLDPNLVAPGHYANRLPFNWDTEAFKTHKADIWSTHGNLQPIKVRKAKGSGIAPYEIVYGHRRHRACFELNLPVLCIVEDLSDADLVVQMTKENSSREDCSSYERGVQFKRVKDDKVFSSNEDLGAAVGLDQSEVARLIRLTNLPLQVVEAFSSPADIRVKWEPKLSKALKVDGHGVLNRAAAITMTRESTTAKQVLATLCALPDARTPAALGRPIEIARDGKTWATIFVPAAADGAGNRVQFAHGAVDVVALETALHELLAQTKRFERTEQAKVRA